MAELRDTIDDIRHAQTWTERVWRISPVALAALKAVPFLAARSARKAAGANDGMSEAVAATNRRALAALGMGGEVVVRGGPFAGMRYLGTSTGSVIGPKLAGTYESEIAPWIAEAVAAGPARIVDLGSAEGYYAVGMARACPGAEVHAFDVDATSQARVGELAALNGVAGRVRVGGLCDTATLRDLLSGPGRTLLIVDVEGAEYDLLDPAAVPALARADMIVELHEHARPGVTWRLLGRFVHTHRIDIASAVPDDVRVADAVAAGRAKDEAEAVVREHRRLPQLWVRMRAIG